MFSSIMPQFVAEFLAGLLGITLGFMINRIYESSRQKNRNFVILLTLESELNYNLGELSILEGRIDSGEWFTQLKNTTWNMFCSQLSSFNEVLVVIDISNIYSDINHLNESMKKAQDIDQLRSIYSNYPPHIEIEEYLDELKKSILYCLSNIIEMRISCA